MAQGQRRPVGAEAEIGRVPEADDTADADQEVQAEGEEREDQDLGSHLQGVFVADKGQEP
jgi:hypothetical protein